LEGEAFSNSSPLEGEAFSNSSPLEGEAFLMVVHSAYKR
jgi:hypothetical protein